MSAEEARQVLEALKSLTPGFVCEAAHHSVKDRHGLGSDCPIECRVEAAIEIMKHEIAQAINAHHD